MIKTISSMCITSHMTSFSRIPLKLLVTPLVKTSRYFYLHSRKCLQIITLRNFLIEWWATYICFIVSCWAGLWVILFAASLYNSIHGHFSWCKSQLFVAWNLLLGSSDLANQSCWNRLPSYMVNTHTHTSQKKQKK